MFGFLFGICAILVGVLGLKYAIIAIIAGISAIACAFGMKKD